MENINLLGKFKNILESFVSSLKETYEEGLVSVILYGSAARGEFSGKYSNLNLLVVLNDTSLPNLKKVSKLVNKIKFRRLNVLFFTPDHIKTSTDVFPIEFLDLKAHHIVLYGKDALKDVQVDIRNLRFQCEQELKEKLLNIKARYLRSRSKFALKDLLFASFTSVSHITKSLNRITDKVSADSEVFRKIKEAKAGNVRLSSGEIESLFSDFVAELEKIVDLVDKI